MFRGTMRGGTISRLQHPQSFQNNVQIIQSYTETHSLCIPINETEKQTNSRKEKKEKEKGNVRKRMLF